MKQLGMQLKYIEWVKQKKKSATTRLTKHECGDYELVYGNCYNRSKSGVIIYIGEVVAWTPLKVSKELMKKILEAENFQTKERFLEELRNLNDKEITDYTILYTHFFKEKKPITWKALEGFNG